MIIDESNLLEFVRLQEVIKRLIPNPNSNLTDFVPDRLF